MDSHRVKNVLGELTFGEYWNVSGCTAYAVKLKGKTSTSFCPADLKAESGAPKSCIVFSFNYGDVFVPLSSKAKVVGHRVITKDVQGEEVTLDFYELTPATGPFGP